LTVKAGLKKKLALHTFHNRPKLFLHGFSPNYQNRAAGKERLDTCLFTLTSGSPLLTAFSLPSRRFLPGVIVSSENSGVDRKVLGDPCHFNIRIDHCYRIIKTAAYILNLALAELQLVVIRV